MTMRGYTHDDARAALAAAALGALGGDELASVRAHARECAECAAELADHEEVAARLALAVPANVAGTADAARSAGTRARLLARAAADRGAAPAGMAPSPSSAPVTPVTPVTPVPSRAARPDARPSRARWPFALAASLLIAVASLAALAAARREQGTLREQLATLGRRATAAESQAAALRDSLAARDQAIAAVTGRDVVVVDLTASGVRAPAARMFWDRASDRWTFVAHDLPQPAAGRTYQLWLVTRAGERVSAGTFAPDARGSARVQATYALPREALQLVAVTDEPTGGVPQPTGPIVIAGGPAD